jgi:hypothetical protein
MGGKGKKLKRRKLKSEIQRAEAAVHLWFAGFSGRPKARSWTVRDRQDDAKRSQSWLRVEARK